MKILKDFLPPSLQENIKHELLSEYFPWYFNDLIAYDNSEKANLQFTHTFYSNQSSNSNWYELIKSILYVIEIKLDVKIKGILRIKSNLQTLNPLLNPLDNIHQDKPDGKFMTLLYYVNDSDGDTLIFDEDKTTIVDRITPEENKAIWFDSAIWHASSPPVTNKRRVVINFILQIED